MGQQELTDKHENVLTDAKAIFSYNEGEEGKQEGGKCSDK